MTGQFVLDASAVLAVVLNEPGRDRILELAMPALVSTVNVAEVRTKLLDLGMSRRDVDSAIQLIDAVEVAFGSEHAVESSELRKSTRQAGLSLGDRACLALAKMHGATALTTDRAWSALGLPCAVEVIR